MKIHCSIARDVLIEGLNSLQNITSKKSTTMAILSNVLIETTQGGLIITGTDLEVGLRLFVIADIHEEGRITLPSKKLFEIVRESGNHQISIEEKENNWVVITAGMSTYNLAGMSGEDFPDFPEIEEDTFVCFKSQIFLELIDKVIYSIANEQENIYSLNAVLFEKDKRDDQTILRMVSSDGHRLSIMEKAVDESCNTLTLNPVTLIPKKGVQEWKKFCEGRDIVNISFEKKQMVLKDEKATMVIRLKGGEFPNYQAIVNTIQLENKLELQRIPFLESLKRINLFTEDNFHTITISLENDKMILSSQNSELGNAKDEQQIIYSGDPMVLGFNCRYFIETLQVMEGEHLEAYINSSSSPCMLKSDQDSGFTSIIMPMQL